MRIELGFGAGHQTLEVPDEALLGVLLPNEASIPLRGDEVGRALASPIGTPGLGNIIGPGNTVAIITSDITRPLPTDRILPALLDALYCCGVRREDITLVFALGSHRRHTLAEKKKLAGERAWNEIRCVDSSDGGFVHYGHTSRGTPVDIARAVAEADKRICLGNIEYHYFAGYSGGAKALMPGVSTRAAIQANHSLMTDGKACAGCLDGNPVREDIEEAAAMVGVDFILNVVLNAHKDIIYALAGDVKAAHRAGCAFLDRLFAVDIQRQADIVVVSQGGAPKDLNLYQAQKALDNAKHAVAQGGTIILVASCKEGFGEDIFEEWITTAPSPESLIERIQREFRLGGHKAAAIAMVLQRADISLVSEMEEGAVRKAFMTPYAGVQVAFDEALGRRKGNASVLILPYGGSTLPRPAEK